MQFKMLRGTKTKQNTTHLKRGGQILNKGETKIGSAYAGYM